MKLNFCKMDIQLIVLVLGSLFLLANCQSTKKPLKKNDPPRVDFGNKGDVCSLCNEVNWIAADASKYYLKEF